MERKRSPDVSRYSADSRDAKSRRTSVPTSRIYSAATKQLERTHSDPDHHKQQSQSSTSRKADSKPQKDSDRYKEQSQSSTSRKQDNKPQKDSDRYKEQSQSSTSRKPDNKPTESPKITKSSTETKKPSSVDTKKTSSGDSKKPFFSSDDMSLMGGMSYELQDDKVRDICRLALSLFSDKNGSINNPKTISDLKKHIVQYELKIDIYEAEYNATKMEDARVKKEIETIEEKRKLVREECFLLFEDLEKARAKRKERMEMENLALVVNEKKSRQDLQAEMNDTDSQINVLLESQAEMEENKKIRYATLLQLSCAIWQLEKEVKEDAETKKIN